MVVLGLEETGTNRRDGRTSSDELAMSGIAAIMISLEVRRSPCRSGESRGAVMTLDVTSPINSCNSRPMDVSRVADGSRTIPGLAVCRHPSSLRRVSRARCCMLRRQRLE